jgi:NAD(P)-dependent dehydrogenase (short-subunit alcohol dehydrogenase family)
MTVALVTGASSGIGRSSAVELARHGWGVVLTYNSNPDGAHEAVAEIEQLGGTGVARPLDLSRSDTFAPFAATLRRTLDDTWSTDRLGALVNNAGLASGTPFEKMTEDAFDRLDRVLLRGPYFLTQHLLPFLGDGSAVVNVTSSTTARYGLEPGYSAYGSLKGALVVLTRYLAKELSPRGIRVNSVSPGPTRTRLGDDAITRHPELEAPLAAKTALGRVGEPADVGTVIAFLLSAEAAWLTAQDIEVSGGFNL